MMEANHNSHTNEQSS